MSNKYGCQTDTRLDLGLVVLSYTNHKLRGEAKQWTNDPIFEWSKNGGMAGISKASEKVVNRPVPVYMCWNQTPITADIACLPLLISVVLTLLIFSGKPYPLQVGRTKALLGTLHLPRWAWSVSITSRSYINNWPNTPVEWLYTSQMHQPNDYTPTYQWIASSKGHSFFIHNSAD